MAKNFSGEELSTFRLPLVTFLDRECDITVMTDVTGTYTVEVDGLVDTFRVKAAPAPTPPLVPAPTPALAPTPAPSTFSLSALSISPPEIEIGEEVTVSVTVTNVGGQSGSYEVTLKVNNAVVDTARISLAAGTSQEVTFTTSKDSAGTHTVDINGKTGTFVVKEAGHWWENVIDNIGNWWDRVIGK